MDSGGVVFSEILCLRDVLFVGCSGSGCGSFCNGSDGTLGEPRSSDPGSSSVRDDGRRTGCRSSRVRCGDTPRSLGRSWIGSHGTFFRTSASFLGGGDGALALSCCSRRGEG